MSSVVTGWHAWYCSTKYVFPEGREASGVNERSDSAFCRDACASPLRMGWLSDEPGLKFCCTKDMLAEGREVSGVNERSGSAFSRDACAAPL